MTCRAAHRSPRFRAAPGLVFVAVAWVATCASTAAQVIDTGTGSDRPYSALFGGAARSTSNRPDSLDFTTSIFGGYDDDIFARGQGPRSPNAQVGGNFVGGQAAANYLHRFTNASFSVNTASALRWLPDTDELVPTFYTAGVGYATALGPRNTLTTRYTAAYRPFFSVVPFAGGNTVGASLQDSGISQNPGLMPTSGPDDFTVSADRPALQHTGTLQLSRRLSPRSGVDVMGDYGVADFRSPEFDDVNNTHWRVAGRYTYDLTKFAALRLGYGYRMFGTGEGDRTGNHDIDVGVNYNQPFVFQRGRTQFAFTTGTTLLVRENVTAEGQSQDRINFLAVGTADLMHSFRAPWQAQLTYARSVGFLDGLSDPYQGDQVMATLGGLLTRSLDLSLSAGYLSGAIGLSDRNFDTAIAGVRLRQGITQNLALFAQYFYFQYSFDDDIAEQLIVAPELERQGFRAGLTLWLPLIR